MDVLEPDHPQNAATVWARLVISERDYDEADGLFVHLRSVPREGAVAVITRRAFLGNAAVLAVLAARKPRPPKLTGTGFGLSPFGTSAFGG